MDAADLTHDEAYELRQIAGLTRDGKWAYRTSKAVLRSLHDKGLIEMALRDNGQQSWPEWRVTDAGRALAATLDVR